MRHPELAGRMRSVQFLGPLQQMLHPGVQQAVQFSGGQRRFDPFTDDNRDRHLRAKQLLGRSLVQIRCAPQTICGTIGTPASIAIRAAPVLNSLISKLRLMVASGYTPTSSPAFSILTAAS